ncbi:MAG: hypothetical protein MI746_11180 [Pseudomonadales bacterium]|nr:hypothetical protein [Pseudomonadales bacterium]
MKLSDTRINTIAHLVTVLSVLAGVGFVVWELEQNRELVRLEMFSEGTIANRQSTLSQAGENPAVVLAKACEASESLSVEDLIILDFVFNETMETINRMRLLEQGLYPANAWRGLLLESRFSFIFSMPAGRAWWQSRDTPAVIKDPVDAYLATLGPPDCAERYATMKERAVALEKGLL